jgi:hypothetical protein
MQAKILFTLFLVLSSVMANYDTLPAEIAAIRRLLRLAAAPGPASLEPFKEAAKATTDYLTMFKDTAVDFINTSIPDDLSTALQSGDLLTLREYDITNYTALSNFVGSSKLDFASAKTTYDNTLKGLSSGVILAAKIFTQAAANPQLTDDQLKSILRVALSSVKKTLTNADASFAEIKVKLEKPTTGVEAASVVLKVSEKSITENRPETSEWFQAKLDKLYEQKMTKCQPFKGLPGICVFGYKDRLKDGPCQMCIDENYGGLIKEFVEKEQEKMDTTVAALQNASTDVRDLKNSSKDYLKQEGKITERLNTNLSDFDAMIEEILSIPDSVDFGPVYADWSQNTIIPALKSIQNMSDEVRVLDVATLFMSVYA